MIRRTSAARFGVWTLAALPALPALAQPIPPPRGSVSPDGNYAYSGQFTYDPSTCSRDAQGMVYFAVGRRVLRQPMDNLGYITGASPSQRRAMPQPPNPGEPWGCPDHPLQAWAYRLRRISAMPGDPPSDVSAEADAFSAIIHTGSPPARRNHLFQLYCAHNNRGEGEVPGFVACGNPKSCFNLGVYEATSYAEPNGIKIALECSFGPDCSAEHARCEGGYMLREHFTVNFSFGVEKLPIAHFPAADQELRRRLEAAEVRDFKWLDESDVNQHGDWK